MGVCVFVFWNERFVLCMCCFFFQAEDGIRYAQESRGLGDVYKRQPLGTALLGKREGDVFESLDHGARRAFRVDAILYLSLIHI